MMLLRRYIGVATVAALLLWSAGAVATLEDGLHAYEAGAYERAWATLHPLAQEGDPEAQYTVALILGKGLGMPADPARAADWLQKAADQGYAPAQARLGLVYYNGQGARKGFG
ncbi:MAG TPA: hypothetical protein VFO41_05330 [Alphaproteobacteria bacterium]|nr:hypothetical protein [Alphaproteobacteria bacterium]